MLSRCKKIRDTLDSCLSQIQNLVPLLLAAKVGVISYFKLILSIVFFIMEEEEKKPYFSPLLFICFLCSPLLIVVVFWAPLFNQSCCMCQLCVVFVFIQGLVLCNLRVFDCAEECVKNSTSMEKDGVKRGLFKLPHYYRESEAELKKMAPPNERMVLVLRC